MRCGPNCARCPADAADALLSPRFPTVAWATQSQRASRGARGVVGLPPTRANALASVRPLRDVVCPYLLSPPSPLRPHSPGKSEPVQEPTETEAPLSRARSLAVPHSSH